MPTPIPDSYWVVPGAILAGEYPGAQNDSMARLKLRAMLYGGVTCFIDLTEEGELNPYAPLLANLGPSSPQYHRFPIRDLGVPSVATMRRILDTVAGAQVAGETVYVHCWGGIGRTGTVIGCYLIENGTPAATAIDVIAQLRRGIPDEWRRSPETDDQRDFVRAWRPGRGRVE